VCSALDSSNKFLWSATLDGNYIDAGDNGNHKGGSPSGWPNVDDGGVWTVHIVSLFGCSLYNCPTLTCNGAGSDKFRVRTVPTGSAEDPRKGQCNQDSVSTQGILEKSSDGGSTWALAPAVSDDYPPGALDCGNAEQTVKSVFFELLTISVLKSWTFCPSRECIDVCIARYGTPTQTTSATMYCAKGCARLTGDVVPLEVLYDNKCSIVEADRYSTCMAGVPTDCSSSESRWDWCREGCKFWDINPPTPVPVRTWIDITGKDCTSYDHLLGFKVVMGDNTDFFKPKPGEMVCSALDSSNKFLWSATLDGDYVDAGDYGRYKGGSLAYWPKENVDGDGRKYLPFWGKLEVNDGTDGCCHLTKDDINRSWGFAFKIFVLDGLAPPTCSDFGGIDTVNPGTRCCHPNCGDKCGAGNCNLGTNCCSSPAVGKVCGIDPLPCHKPTPTCSDFGGIDTQNPGTRCCHPSCGDKCGAGNCNLGTDCCSSPAVGKVCGIDPLPCHMP